MQLDDCVLRHHLWMFQRYELVIKALVVSIFKRDLIGK